MVEVDLFIDVPLFRLCSFVTFETICPAGQVSWNFYLPRIFFTSPGQTGRL